LIPPGGGRMLAPGQADTASRAAKTIGGFC
jgi:hypothetical protein